MRTAPGRGKRVGVWIACGALLLLAVACTDSAYGTYTAPPVVTSSALQPTIEQAQVDRYLSAIEAEETLRRYYADQTATAEARKAAEWQATMTADVQAWNMTATAQVREWETTATAIAWQTTATAEAQARAIAWENATATAQAIRTENDLRMTAVAWQVTQTAVAAEQAANDALRAEQLAREQLATKRERLVYPVKAYGPWVILIATVVVIIWGAWRLIRASEHRVSVVHRDARGDAPLIPVRTPGGGIVLLDPDRSFGPAMVVDGSGKVSQPALVAPEAQERTTARDQAIDLAHRGLPGGTATPRRVTPQQAAALAQSTTPVSLGPVQVVNPGQVRAWLRDVEPQALQQALTLEGEVRDVE